MFHYRILVALLPLLAAGCTFNMAPVREAYPARWQPLRPVGNSSCQEFVGIYNAMGEDAASTSQANTLRLLGVVGLIRTVDAAYASLQAAYVSIQLAQDGSAYNMVALNSAKQPIMVAGTSEPISCSGGSLVRNYTRSSYADGNSHESHSYVTLSLAADGALVAHVTGASNTSDLLFESKQNYDRFCRFTRSE